MPDTFYRQCLLRRVNGATSISWIPEKYAIKGKYIKIKRSEAWENGWQIVATYGKKKEKELIDQERDYLKQRSVSDA